MFVCGCGWLPCIHGDINSMDFVFLSFCLCSTIFGLLACLTCDYSCYFLVARCKLDFVF